MSLNHILAGGKNDVSLDVVGLNVDNTLTVGGLEVGSIEEFPPSTYTNISGLTDPIVSTHPTLTSLNRGTITSSGRFSFTTPSVPTNKILISSSTTLQNSTVPAQGRGLLTGVNLAGDLVAVGILTYENSEDYWRLYISNPTGGNWPSGILIDCHWSGTRSWAPSN